jgi:hypothetical protein
MSNAILRHHFLAVHLLTVRYLRVDRKTIWITQCLRNFDHVGIANTLSLHTYEMSCLTLVMLNVGARELAARPGEYTNLHRIAVMGFRRGESSPVSRLA